MRLKVQIAVTSDDGQSTRTSENGLALATGIPGVEESSAKQDFLAQAEGLMRTVVENQLPALYAEVYAEDKQREADRRQAESQQKLQAKIKAMRERKGRKPESDDAAQEVQNAAPAADDIVECTDCGAKVEHDAAHYVSVVADGKYDRDAVLCDACYDKLMAETAKANAGADNGGGE